MQRSECSMKHTVSGTGPTRYLACWGGPHADTCHCPSLTAHPEVVLLGDTYEPSFPPSCGVCLAPGAERCMTAGGWRWGLEEGVLVDAAQECSLSFLSLFTFLVPSSLLMYTRRCGGIRLHSGDCVCGLCSAIPWVKISLLDLL